ncbi:MAG: LLM class flavin-dependent oxidoreductase [Gordonia sp. (in: high G+C Gram-positive bacteria)]
MTTVGISFQTDLLDDTDQRRHIANMADQAVLADRLGYHSVWVNESHLDVSGQISDPLIFLAHIGGRTTHLQLGTAVICAPLYDPIRLAESAILFDHLSNGRLRLGIGIGDRRRGLSRAWEFYPDNVDARTLEIIDILVQAFDTGSVTYAGNYYRYNDVRLTPTSARKARDIIVAGTDRNYQKILSRYSFDLISPRLQPLADRQQEFDFLRREHPENDAIVLRYASVASDHDEAVERAIPWLQTYLHRYRKEHPTAEWIRDNIEKVIEDAGFAIGTPDEVVEILRRWGRDRDLIALDFGGPWVPQKYSLTAIELLAARLVRSGDSSLSIPAAGNTTTGTPEIGRSGLPSEK